MANVFPDRVQPNQRDHEDPKTYQSTSFAPVFSNALNEQNSGPQSRPEDPAIPPSIATSCYPPITQRATPGDALQPGTIGLKIVILVVNII